jgi:hypothetical protein
MMVKLREDRALDEQDTVFFNGFALPQLAARQLRGVGVPLGSSGRYWYDPKSGWWGIEGGPAAGQLPPGLDLGGPLRADASGGGTGTFINGRELHPTEVQQLSLLFGSVPRVRFWMNAQGIGGPEGGPATFSLQAAAQARPGPQGGLRRGTFGTTGGDAGSFYFFDPDSGASVMLGD